MTRIQSKGMPMIVRSTTGALVCKVNGVLPRWKVNPFSADSAKSKTDSKCSKLQTEENLK